MGGTLHRPLLQRWVEHYSDLYSIVSLSALDAVECLSTIKELDTDPTLEELSKAMDRLASGKAPGGDGIPSDLIKHCKTTLFHSLHVVFCQCWQEGETQGTPRSSHSSRTKERGATATNTEASPFSASLAKSLRRSSWPDCRSWQNVSILNHSVASELEGQQSTWSSLFVNSRRSAENNRCPCISLSLTSQRRLISSAETVSSRFLQRSPAHQNCRAWLNPSKQTWNG